MHIFITGASGFVGGAAARRLLAAGHRVSAMSRSEKSDAAIRTLGAAPVRCDLANVSAAHLASCDVVVHAAAFVEAWGPAHAWFEANVLGTQAMLDAARMAGARRFIHIGTEAAIVFGQDVRGADETYPLAPDSPYPYCATKAQAEARVRVANVPDVFETIILRPRFIWGPGDATLLPAIETMAANGGWRWIDGGRARTSTTHIDNLVHAIELAMAHGTGGEAYFILDDGDVTMREMVARMAASKGVDLGDKQLPGWAAAAAAALSETIWRLFGRAGAPPITRHAAMVMRRDCTLIGDKAKAELGYIPFVTRDAGLAAMKES